ncbi:putative protein kinase [Paratrimastix pyriformis]|uniref:Protein kinase domain-containing protein n=1 Tax=Paratrimastix pyriformis TaxID=342808 RepID=A0ABQ8UWM8_9EUKA|nr:putative protein kinase [Paratrimastix pyriformis]
MARMAERRSKALVSGTSVFARVGSNPTPCKSFIFFSQRLFDTSDSPELEAEFRHEVSVMRTLRHPHILGFVGATFNPPRIIVTASSCNLPPTFRHPVCVYAVLMQPSPHLPSDVCVYAEYMENGSLFGLLHNDQLELPMNLRIQMALDMALGISYLHHLLPPIVHRDIKSQNMLVSADMRIKIYIGHLVSDFGISRLTDDKGIATAAGTPGWSSPEVLRGERSGLPSDAFSFGVVLWELATRQVPWNDTPPIRVAMTVASGGRLPVPASIPPILATLIQECFAEDPAQRPTFDQIVQRLTPVVQADPPRSVAELMGDVTQDRRRRAAQRKKRAGGVEAGAPVNVGSRRQMTPVAIAMNPLQKQQQQQQPGRLSQPLLRDEQI